MKASDLTADDVRDNLDYDSNTGVFTWRANRTSTVRKGSVAGLILKHTGYVQISLHYHSYRAHRLAWLYTYGEWPNCQIDHINGIRSDNRLRNLREATQAQNSQNRHKAHKTSHTGVLGVGFEKARNKWTAEVFLGGRRIYRSRHTTMDEAKAAHRQAKVRFHKFQTLDECSGS